MLPYAEPWEIPPVPCERAGVDYRLVSPFPDRGHADSEGSKEISKKISRTLPIKSASAVAKRATPRHSADSRERNATAVAKLGI